MCSPLLGTLRELELLCRDTERALVAKHSKCLAQHRSILTAQQPNPAVCSHLLGPLRELERLYRDAEQALVGRPSQGQLPAEAGSAAAARAALFDDDLDLRGPDRNSAGRQVLRSL